MQNILDVKDRSGLRQWLTDHHDSESECYVRCVRGRPPEDGSLWYIDVVEEALCFGWVDSTVRYDDIGPVQRLSPRRRNSHWTELNKERVRRLERMGLMTDAGRSVLPDMTTDLDELFPDIMDRVRDDGDLFERMSELPELYVRIRIDGMAWSRLSKYAGDYEKKYERFREFTLKGRMYGQWNDYGRLL